MGIEVAELPGIDEIDVPPALPPRTAPVAPERQETHEDAAPTTDESTDEAEQKGDRRLVLIALAIVAVVAIVAVAWALLV